MDTREKIAKELYIAEKMAGNGSFIIASHEWDDDKVIDKDKYFRSADAVLVSIKEASSNCFYCGQKADGAMLTMGSYMAHTECVIRKLNELLDPDYNGEDEPDKVIGFLDGWVKLAEDQSYSWESTGNTSPSDCQRCFDTRYKEGWRKVRIKDESWRN